ncbi:MAG: signal recognition particle-docking protein FtsY [Gemmatimonadetes bacterium]|nr:MAG: signal recognition particle-docking protein FtsY [Gemmatimonadota bacterium]
MPKAGPTCGCRPANTAMRRLRDRSAAWWWSIATPTNGAPRRRWSLRNRVRRGHGSAASRCATAGGCSCWRSPRSQRSGRGGDARDCRDNAGKRETGSVSLWRRLVQAVRRSPGANATEAERILLEADFGVEATEQILAAVSRATDGEFRAAVERAVTAALDADPAPADRGALARASTPPTVILVFGVNGVGKTTTVAKLAARLARAGRSVLLAAADTFRAGATEQLQTWAGRLGVHAVTGTGDPAAVAFDAIAAARARGADTVLVDTAGRLHTEDRLLEELKKVVRVVAKQQPGAPHESLLVLDGTVGQNAVHQARAFAAAVPLSGLVVTKLDGTAKGGSVVALQRAVRVPVRFLGMGEGLEDLEVFDAARYAHRLVSG